MGILHRSDKFARSFTEINTYRMGCCNKDPRREGWVRPPPAGTCRPPVQHMQLQQVCQPVVQPVVQPIVQPVVQQVVQQPVVQPVYQQPVMMQPRPMYQPGPMII